MWRCFAAVLAVATAVSMTGCKNPPVGANPEQMQNDIVSIQQENQRLQDELALVSEQLEAAKRELQKPPEPDKWEAEKQAALDDLLSHPELIPIEGVLGGTMHFYPDSAYVMQSGDIYVYAEDGHFGIEMIFHNRSDQQNIYEWELAASKIGDKWMLGA